MTTTLIAGTFATGKILRRALPVRTASCEQILNAAGTITASLRLPVIDPNTGLSLPIVQDLQEGRAFLGYVQDGKLLNAGPIWSSTYDADTNIWTLSAAGARSYFDYRYVIPALVATGGASIVGNPSTFNSSLRTIAKQLVAQAAQYGAPPIDYEADVAGTDTRTYASEALKTLGSALTDLTGVDGGPDIMLVPYITADGNYVRWQLQTGSPEIAQSGSDVVWDTTATVPSATSISVTRSATTLATDAYEIGATTSGTDASGNSVSTVVSSANHDATLRNTGMLPMETSESRTDVSVQATLDGYAAAATKAGRFLTETWTFKARLGVSPGISEVSAGTYGQVKYKSHPILGAGSTRVRVLSIGCNFGDAFATIGCAPQRVV